MELKCTNESVDTCFDAIREKHEAIKAVITKVTLQQNNKKISSKKLSEVVKNEWSFKIKYKFCTWNYNNKKCKINNTFIQCSIVHPILTLLLNQ